MITGLTHKHYYFLRLQSYICAIQLQVNRDRLFEMWDDI